MSNFRSFCLSLWTYSRISQELMSFSRLYSVICFTAEDDLHMLFESFFSNLCINLPFSFTRPRQFASPITSMLYPLALRCSVYSNLVLVNSSCSEAILYNLSAVLYILIKEFCVKFVQGGKRMGQGKCVHHMVYYIKAWYGGDYFSCKQRCLGILCHLMSD